MVQHHPQILHWLTLLYCTILYCTVLYCTVLYCTVLYCTVLYCIYCISGFVGDTILTPSCSAAEDPKWRNFGVTSRCHIISCHLMFLVRTSMGYTIFTYHRHYPLYESHNHQSFMKKISSHLLGYFYTTQLQKSCTLSIQFASC